MQLNAPPKVVHRSAQNKKSEIDWKSYILGAITDLVIGIILIILDKLLN